MNVDSTTISAVSVFLSVLVSMYVAYTSRRKTSAEANLADSGAMHSMAEASKITVDNLSEEVVRLTRKDKERDEQLNKLSEQNAKMQRELGETKAEVVTLQEKVRRLIAQVESLGHKPVV